MDLYFLNDRGEEELVRNEVSVEDSCKVAQDHLKQRKPDATINAIREWNDIYDYHWIDFGRSGGFYILH